MKISWHCKKCGSRLNAQLNGIPMAEEEAVRSLRELWYVDHRPDLDTPCLGNAQKTGSVK